MRPIFTKVKELQSPIIKVYTEDLVYTGLESDYHAVVAVCADGVWSWEPASGEWWLLTKENFPQEE